jgi:hypothetical protein
MVNRLEFAERALRPYLEHSKLEIDPRAAQKGVREILSTPSTPRISQDEMNIFASLCCIMFPKSEKWLSTIQV